MVAIIISMLFGASAMKMVDHTTAYCECKRDQFKGAYCQSFKQSKEDSCR